MSIEQFWQNLRFAKRELDTIDRVLVPGTNPPRRLSLDLWLIPQTVEGFESRDFPFLSDEERRKLENLVERFRQQATQVNAERRPAKPDEANQAKADLMEILNVVEFDRYSDASDYRVGKILDHCKAILVDRGLPVVDLLHQIEIDSTGDEALWVWVIVPDKVAESDIFFEESEKIREALEHLLQSHQVEYWPHVRFWAESERDEEVDD